MIKKEIYVIKSKRRVMIPESLWNMLAIYKVFFPPDTTIQLGKERTIVIKDIEVWPPPVQTALLEVEEKKNKQERNMG